MSDILDELQLEKLERECFISNLMLKHKKIEEVSLENVSSPYGEERFNLLDNNYIEKLANSKMHPTYYNPILITKDYKIIDGHHRYMAVRKWYSKDQVPATPYVHCIKFNCFFTDTWPLRDFTKHLKGMVPESWDYPKCLKSEFEGVLQWIIQNISK